MVTLSNLLLKHHQNPSILTPPKPTKISRGGPGILTPQNPQKFPGGRSGIFWHFLGGRKRQKVQHFWSVFLNQKKCDFWTQKSDQKLKKNGYFFFEIDLLSNTQILVRCMCSVYDHKRKKKSKIYRKWEIFDVSIDFFVICLVKLTVMVRYKFFDCRGCWNAKKMKIVEVFPKFCQNFENFSGGPREIL